MRISRHTLQHALAQWRQHRCAATAVAWSEEKLKMMNRIEEHFTIDDRKGIFRLGKDFCNTFDVAHPKRRTTQEYLRVLETKYAELKKTIPKPKAKPLNPEKLLPRESKTSCFRRTPTLVAKNEELRRKFDRVLILDFETTNSVYNNRRASPFLPSNRIVYTAWKKDLTVGGSTSSGAQVDGPFAERSSYQLEFPSLDDVDAIVGHNLKFDLLYIWDDAELKRFFKRGGVIWDTMYAQYILGGHNIDQKLSLDALAMDYGGTVKDAYIKEQWDKGVGTEDIDVDKMREYAANDVINTELVFRQQLDVLTAGCRLPMVLSHMDGLLATTEMEFNGLYVAVDVAQRMDDEEKAKLAKAEVELRQAFTPPEVVAANEKHRAQLAPEALIEFNWGSTSQLRAYLFGGSATYKVKMASSKEAPKKKEAAPKKGAKKSTKKVPEEAEAKVKFTYQDVRVDFAGIVPVAWQEKNRNRYFNEGTDLWKVSDDVIQSIATEYGEEKWAEAIGRLGYIKRSKKLSSTYLQPFMNMVDNKNIMRPNLNHTLTRTGRLSSNNPNMQNIPRQGVKQCLTTRFMDADCNPTGKMIESDYSQLEVFVNALLSQDKVLMEELESGADLHCKRLARMRGRPYEEVVELCKKVKDPYWCDQRTKAKVFSFQRQYGAGPKTIAQSTGLDRSEVEKMIQLEEQTYSGVRTFFERVTQGLHETAANGAKAKHGYYDAPSGNRWYFEQTPARSFARASRFTKPKMEFKKQLVLNHPVQGFAAEIVLTCLGRLWRTFLARGNFSATGDFNAPARALMVNTVHDCVWVDSSDEVADEVMSVVTATLADVRGAFDPLGYHIPEWMQFKTDTHKGLTMADV